MQKKVIIPPDGGITKYQPWNLIPDNAWSDGLNVHFGVGFVQKIYGWEKYFTDILGSNPLMAEPIRHFDNFYKKNDNSWLIVCGNTKVYHFLNGVFTCIADNLQATDDHFVMTETYNDYFILANGIDRVQQWDGIANTMIDVVGLDDAILAGTTAGVDVSSAKNIINYAGFLILGDTVEDGNKYPQRIRWCQINDHTKWKNNVDGSGQAGWMDLTDGVDWIQNMKQLGNYLVVYKERSIHILYYVGGDIIFEKRPAIIGTGLIAPNAIVDLGDEHIFVAPDNIYSFDLIEPKIACDDLAKEFFRILDPGKAGQIEGFFIEEIPEAIFTFTSIYQDPDSKYPDMALVYNTDTKKWSIRDLPMTAFGYYNLSEERTIDSIEYTIDSMDMEFDSSTNLANAPINICGDKDGYIYVLRGNSKDGTTMTSMLQSKLFDLDAPEKLKRVKRIQFMISREGPYNLEVEIGTVANVGEDVQWHGPFNMSLNTTFPPWIDVDVTGRYFVFRFKTTDSNASYKLTGWIIYYTERGSV